MFRSYTDCAARTFRLNFVRVSIPLIALAIVGAVAAAAVAWSIAADRRARDLRRSLDTAGSDLNAARLSLAAAQQSEAALRSLLEAERRNATEKLALL